MDTEFIQSGFVQVVPKNSRDANKIANELNRKEAVWKAYVAPRPVPAMLPSPAHLLTLSARAARLKRMRS